MPTTSILAYQGFIDQEVKTIACSFEWCSLQSCLNDSEAVILLPLIKSAPVNNIMELMTHVTHLNLQFK